MEELTLAPAPPAGLVVRRAVGAGELVAFAELYRHVFDDAAHGISPRLLSAMNTHSGVVIGAWEGERPVGFTYGFLAQEPQTGRLYLYSQAAGVVADRRNSGVGRALKRAQAEAALSAGVTLMRWSYDPLKSRNAHFNLDVLGGRARVFIPDFYGEEPHGLATDRLIVDWELAVPAGSRYEQWRGLPPAPTEPGHVVRSGDGRALLTVPEDWPDHDRFTLREARTLQGAVAAELTGLLADGYAAVSCRRVRPGRSAYLLVRDY
ncbi:hypothetical protein ACFU5O_24860 [Streptomyces sp. NPDC057445]|uniref:hypothetical protein n=1 Tax=Streptomyces sp. NPDC057445 TaxID=3346136 RepID=UPI0036B8BCF6